MSAFSAAASDEDCDEITRLREQRDDLLEALRAQRDELLEALRITVQSLAWFHDGLERPNDALSIARMAIEKATREAA